MEDVAKKRPKRKEYWNKRYYAVCRQCLLVIPHYHRGKVAYKEMDDHMDETNHRFTLVKAFKHNDPKLLYLQSV